ncbi:MAG: class I SAM-dependent methyltransferase [Bacteroidetes bacterium]|nr:class I SAM-dependent methyltransferase [Bacteroidota bacterium]
MITTSPFNDHVEEYEAWFEKYPFVFRSEVAAIKQLLPDRKIQKGIEIGVGTGRFAKALGITDGIEPAPRMREAAEKRGVFVLNAKAEDLPYHTGQFEFVLMNFCVSYFDDVQEAFGEAYRVLKPEGMMIVGFVEKNSPIARLYERRGAKSLFYSGARFYSTASISYKLNKAGFRKQEMYQTLFHLPGRIKTVESARPGRGEGSYIFLKAIK